MEAETQPSYGRKVFVASSMPDLIDLRDEVRSYLDDLGLMPLMCEHSFKDAKDTPGDTSKRCDQNVQGADAVVVIVAERYGTRRPAYFPSPGKKSGPSFAPSYTHAEYLEARHLGKPVYFYARSSLAEACKGWVDRVVRERLQRELHVAQDQWSRQSGTVSASSKRRRTSLLLRVCKALARAPQVESTDFPQGPGLHTTDAEELKKLYCFLLCQMCWPKGLNGLITSFDTVVDLKRHLRNDLDANRLVANYEDLLRAGKLPFIRVANAKAHAEYSPNQDVYLKLTSVAPTPAAFDSVSGVYVAPLNPTKSLFFDRKSNEVRLTGADLPLKVGELNWSPEEPSVLRDGEERVVRLCLDSAVPGARWARAELAQGFCVWVVYQSVLGEPIHMADQYAVTLSKNGTWSVSYGGKRVLPPEADPAAGAARTVRGRK